MEDGEVEAMIIKFEHTMFRQLRTFGIVLHDDAGNLIKPGSAEEIRVLRNISRNCLQHVVLNQPECQTPVEGSDL